MQTAFTKTFYGGARESASRGALTRRAAPRGEMREDEGATLRDGVSRRAKGLGLLSIALGVTQLLSPGGLAKRIGTGDGRRIRSAMLAVGAREIVCGLGILTSARPAGWLWARVAGDIIDLALLGRSLDRRRANRPKVLQSMASVAGILVLDALTAVQAGRGAGEGLGRRARRSSIRVVKAITVNRPVEEVYQFWHDFQNLPRFMVHLEAVRVLDGGRRSRWRAKGLAGMKIEWDAEMVEDRPNERIAWRSLPDADVDNAGTVSFAAAEGGRGTVLRVDFRYEPPGKALGVSLAKLFGKIPEQQIENDLRRFKQVIETGEVLHSDASIHRGPHPARPPRREELEALR